MSVLALFYLLVVPAMTASGNLTEKYSVPFGAFMLIQMSLLIILFFYRSLCSSFGFKQRLFERLQFYPFSRKDDEPLDPIAALVTAFISYMLMIYGFGVIYAYLSNIDVQAFSTENLTILDSVYFSLMTASTVGYGDVSPVSNIAKLFVMSEVVISMVYVIILFSSAVSYLREK
jgi:voltage-gated potassium channel